MKQHVPIVVSVTALVVAVLGATPAGEAARSLVIPKGSVGTPQLKNGAVSTPKLKNGAVTSPKVLNGSLLAEDFKAGQLPGGQKGDQGDPGPPGPPGVSEHEVVFASTAANSDSPKSRPVACPAGKRVLGGGARVVPGYAAVVESSPTTGAPGVWTGWLARAQEPVATANNWTLAVYAVCGKVG